MFNPAPLKKRSNRSWSFSFAGRAAAVAAEVAAYKPTMDHEQVEAVKEAIVKDLAGWTPDYPVSVVASGHYGQYGANSDGSPRHYRSLKVEVSPVHSLCLNPAPSGFPAPDGNGGEMSLSGLLRRDDTARDPCPLI